MCITPSKGTQRGPLLSEPEPQQCVKGGNSLAEKRWGSGRGKGRRRGGSTNYCHCSLQAMTPCLLYDCTLDGMCQCEAVLKFAV